MIYVMICYVPWPRFPLEQVCKGAGIHLYQQSICRNQKKWGAPIRRAYGINVDLATTWSLAFKDKHIAVIPAHIGQGFPYEWFRTIPQ